MGPQLDSLPAASRQPRKIAWQQHQVNPAPSRAPRPFQRKLGDAKPPSVLPAHLQSTLFHAASSRTTVSGHARNPEDFCQLKIYFEKFVNLSNFLQS
jgi:hypothetical protein